MNCPIKTPKILRLCEACMFSKDGVCDYPYYRDMSAEEIKETTERLKDLGGKG